MSLVSLHDVLVHFEGANTPALHPMSLDISDGEAVGIVGESGSGKTTLGRVLAGILTPTAGQSQVEGRPWSTVKRTDDARRHVQMIFQDPYGSLNPHQTARAVVTEAMAVWRPAARAELQERAAALLASVGLNSDQIDRRPSQLSGGQCQRIGIARALAVEPRLIIADEPTSSLDVSVQAQILNLLTELNEQGLALVLVSHDLHVVRQTTDRVLVMKAGRVVEEGPTEEILNRPSHPYTQLLLESLHNNDAPKALEPDQPTSHRRTL